MAFAFKLPCRVVLWWVLGAGCSAPQPSPAVQASSPASPASGPTVSAPVQQQAAPEPRDALPVAVEDTAPEARPPAALLDSPPDASGWGVAAGLRYLEIVRGDASADEPLPLLLVIHGLGDSPDPGWVQVIDVAPELKARMILPQAPTPYGRGFAWFEYRFRDRNEAALAQGISGAEAQLARMLEVLRSQRPSRGRALVSGFSQGGMLSFALALNHPELVEVAVPISGQLPAPLWPQSKPRGQRLPKILALHGTADPVVAFEADDALVRHLQSLGFPAQLVAFEGVRHSIAPAMRERVGATLSDVLRAAGRGR